MKAIINTKKSSGMAYLNGHTFEVKEVFSTFVAMSIPSQLIEGKFDTMDFLFNEIIIVDIDQQLQLAYDSYNWGVNNHFNALESYCHKNNIKTKLEYNCPA